MSTIFQGRRTSQKGHRCGGRGIVEPSAGRPVNGGAKVKTLGSVCTLAILLLCEWERLPERPTNSVISHANIGMPWTIENQTSWEYAFSDPREVLCESAVCDVKRQAVAEQGIRSLESSDCHQPRPCSSVCFGRVLGGVDVFIRSRAPTWRRFA